MKGMHIVTWILIIVGALNWGLVGLGGFTNADWNVVRMIASYLGGAPVENAIYVLVGLSAVWELVSHRKSCKMCSGGMM